MNWLHQLTQEYRTDETLADVFGVVLYTDEHPYIKKVLRDKDFWSALDEQSGPEWTIFSIRPTQGSSEFPDFEPEPGVFYQMIPVWNEPNENKELLEYFDISSTEKLPLLVIYTHDENGEILKLSWNIHGKSQEDVYQALSHGIKVVRGAIDVVSSENKKYSEGIFRAIERAVDNQVTIQRIKKGLNFYAFFKSLLP